jgi:thiol:disulfide interchange protein DsbA
MMSALQRAFYTLDAMGKEEELHGKIFNAFHVERQPLYTENAVVDFLAKNGIDRQKYLATANSFAMQSKTQRAKQQYINYGVDRIGVPTLVVDGRFITSPGTASKGPNASEQENGASALHVMDQLLARIAAERGTAVAAPQKK